MTTMVTLTFSIKTGYVRELELPLKAIKTSSSTCRSHLLNKPEDLFLAQEHLLFFRQQNYRTIYFSKAGSVKNKRFYFFSERKLIMEGNGGKYWLISFPPFPSMFSESYLPIDLRRGCVNYDH